MAEVRPFQPFRYTAAAGDLATLVTQPYDKIPDDLRERYLAANPRNFVRLIKGKPEPGEPDDAVYERAARLLDEWIASGVVARDPEPAFYPYFQEFSHPETGARVTRKGFIGLLRLEEYDRGVVHRHELTHRGPKLDRLKLTEAARAYFGQLFMLYDDPELRVDALLDEAARGPALMSAEEEGVAHRVWRLAEPSAVAEIQRLMADRKILIADGHHRYETALAFRRAHPELPGAAFCMMTFVNMSSEGLLVLATHRLIDGLADFDPSRAAARAAEGFEVRELESAQELRRALAAAPPERAAIGAVFGGDPAYRLLQTSEAMDGELDVSLLHRRVIGEALGISAEDVAELKGVRYVRGFDQAVEDVRSGRAQAAFLLRPVDVKKVAEVSFSGGVMPQKSTDFYPKLLSGFTTYRFG